MQWPRCTGGLIATSLAGGVGTWDALRSGAGLVAALGSGGLVATIWCGPTLLAELGLARWVRGRPLAVARLRVATVAIAAGALALAWIRAPMLARFSDRVLAGWLWAALALALLVAGVAIGEPLSRVLARRERDDAHAGPIAIAVALVLASWIVWSLVAAPPVRGLAAALRT